jgi:ribonuclease E
MPNKMLIDAAHPEETRVVVLRGNRVEEFDFESASRKLLRGNIYLAKVTRVEPSLQAAFVDYGGNRHGFLAFSEIHPDYYQIPVADRRALIEAEERENAEAEERAATERDKDARSEEAVASEEAGPEDGAPEAAVAETETVAAEASETAAVVEEAPETGEAEAEPQEVSGAPATAPEDDGDEVESDESVDSVGAEDAMEEVPERRRARVRQYKIQEVIKRRQVLLVQVVKEERGTKGAALSTYLSLAGRYCVLMPNTARGGGISRKITSATDRKRLRQVVSELEVPSGMGVILRTAGASRTKAELKRDFEYLLRLWENVRELTLQSTAPTLVYEEGSLIKRSIRDLYNKDIDEILISGDEAYKEAKEFMRMLMPSHAKNVKPYKDSQPIFARSGIEAQLDGMFSPQVTLRSGGYMVINQTEALVSIDVNSGRATREHNIEDTALQTNLEAAEEVARQLRLRDLAGLIVIDFIDMEEKRNNRAVERKLKEALKNDRARIQVGRISHFGLLEMSRQRLRTGVVESTTSVCPTCQGTGHVRAPASVALHVLRALEDQLPKGVTHDLIIRTRTPVALYMLNQKRAHLFEIEKRFALSITVTADEAIADGAHFMIERGQPIERREEAPTSVQPDSVQPEEEASATDEAAASGEERESQADGARKRRRRRRRPGAAEKAAEGEEAIAAGASEEAEETAEGEEQPRKRRRGRRGGRRGRRGRGEERTSAEAGNGAEAPARARGRNGANGSEMVSAAPEAEAAGEEQPTPAMEMPSAIDVEPAEAPEPAEAAPSETRAEPEDREAPSEPPPVERISEDREEAEQPKRSGWWQRRSFF